LDIDAILDSILKICK